MKVVILSEKDCIETVKSIENAIACLELRFFKHPPPTTITEILYLAEYIKYLNNLKKKFE